jgi:hypothetical protein
LLGTQKPGLGWVKSGLSRVRDLKLTPFLRYEENGG